MRCGVRGPPTSVSSFPRCSCFRLRDLLALSRLDSILTGARTQTGEGGTVTDTWVAGAGHTGSHTRVRGSSGSHTNTHTHNGRGGPGSHTGEGGQGHTRHTQKGVRVTHTHKGEGVKVTHTHGCTHPRVRGSGSHTHTHTHTCG